MLKQEPNPTKGDASVPFDSNVFVEESRMGWPERGWNGLSSFADAQDDSEWMIRL